MINRVPYIRVFISSPGDVNAERQIAMKIIDQIPYRPAFRDRVAFQIIAWDKEGAGTPMRANKSPQEAINQGLPKPSECNIVVVIFWSRIGTRLTHGGKDYLSGTHWELLNALEVEHTQTLIYRRMDAPSFSISPPDYEKERDQYQAVKEFFQSDLFYTPDGKIKRGVNIYKKTDDFEQQFETAMEVLTLEILNQLESSAMFTEADITDYTKDNIRLIHAVTWPSHRSPFPGLRTFKETDADIFFGRSYETDSLVRQLTVSHFVAVIGASGSGKSSLVGAGLIPRLRANAIIGSKDWYIISFTPNDTPLHNLADALIRELPSLRLADILKNPEHIDKLIETALADKPEWVNVLLFIDQFEELFTLTHPDEAGKFVQILDDLTKSQRVRVVTTMRADFYFRAVEYPQLAELLRAGSFPITTPKRDALRQMIERPAERARLAFDDGLVDRILTDTGDEPGNLALMAFALDELYKLSNDKKLSHEQYDQLGRVQGAIAARAENAFSELEINDAVIQRVFNMLIEVNEYGTVTRRPKRVYLESLTEDDHRLINTFTNKRLFTTNYDETDGVATIEVAHEAILREWPRLVKWLEATQDDRRIVTRMKRDARIWDERRRPEHMLPNAETIQEFTESCERLGEVINDESLKYFIKPEQDRLYHELDNSQTTHARRRDIGIRLAEIGDTRRGIGIKDGIPDIYWLFVEGSDGVYRFKSGEFDVKPFFIAKFLVTYKQYQTFLDADDGYSNPKWWAEEPQTRLPQRVPGMNSPRDCVSWYQSMAFARWLDFRSRESGLMSQWTEEIPLALKERGLGDMDKWQIRLPTEWEWQWAAQGGTKERQYPWGADWKDEHANTSEAGLSRTTAVGMYPHGSADCGAQDMAGNLWEWCYSEHIVQLGQKANEWRAIRGGSFDSTRETTNCTHQNRKFPHEQKREYGFRLVIGEKL